jgi:DNA-binding CsgD family transcriptional regulator
MPTPEPQNTLRPFTLDDLSDIPIDIHSQEYQHFSKIIKRFPEEAVYIFSFAKNRLIYAAGWEETLGYTDTEINLQTIVSQTDPMYIPFSNDLNAKAVKFIMSKRKDMEKYSFSIELKKIHKNGTLVPMMVNVGIYSVEKNGEVKEAIGRFRVNNGLRFGKVMRYAAYGPEKNEFEEELNKSLFNYFAISDKEKQALQLLSKGYSFKEMAHELEVSVSALEKRIQPMYKRFNVKSLAHLISFSYENFILP